MIKISLNGHTVNLFSVGKCKLEVMPDFTHHLAFDASEEEIREFAESLLRTLDERQALGKVKGV